MIENKVQSIRGSLQVFFQNPPLLLLDVLVSDALTIFLNNTLFQSKCQLCSSVGLLELLCERVIIV